MSKKQQVYDYPSSQLGPSSSIAWYATPVTYSNGTSSYDTTFVPSNEVIRLQTDWYNNKAQGFEFLIRSESLETAVDVTALYITTSTKDLKVGFGTKDPVSSLDIRSVTSSSPANLILRTNEDGVITAGEETGRIIFAIESSSFRGSKVITSGSVGDIFGEVLGQGSFGAYGKLMFSVNDSNGQNPKSIFQLGYGASGGGSDYEVFISASDLFHDDSAPQYVQKTDGTTITTLGFRDSGNNKNVGKLTIRSASVERLLIDGLDGSISASGDISIKGFTSVSASLAAASGGGTPGGSNTQVQYNNSGNFGGDSNFTWNDSTNTLSVLSSSLDLVLVNDKLQGNGSGFQFFAFNEDTIKVKFANWYSSNARQYGMGQLWFETWFAAIDNGASRDERRIGFYLEEPDAGSTDSGTPGQHPTNARFYVDITGSYVASGGLHVTDADFNVESNGNVGINGTLDMNNNDINNVNINGGAF